MLRCYAAMDGVVAVPPRIETTLLPIADFAYSPLLDGPSYSQNNAFHFFAVGGSNSNQKTKSRSNFSSPTVCHSKNGNIEVSAIIDFLTLIINNKMLLCNYSVLKKNASFFYSPCYLS